jgi:large subunit ribosomal protein L30e
MSYDRGQMKLKKRKRTSAKKEFDENKEINVAVKTGKVLVGANSVLSELATGSVKLIILANNAPKKVTDRLNNLNYSLPAQVPIYITNNSSLDLGAVCGKPYWISTLAIVEPGDSSIMKAVEK